MMTATPTRWYSWDYTVSEGATPVANIDMSTWREKAVLTVEGKAYSIYREGMFGGDFILESGGSVLARAEKPSAFHRTFIVKHRDRHYTLKAKSAIRSSFILWQGDTEVGSVSRIGWFNRNATVQLPEELPRAVQVFITWLAILLWKREAGAAAA